MHSAWLTHRTIYHFGGAGWCSWGDLVRPENEGEVGWTALAFHFSSLTACPLILIRVWGVGCASFNHPGTIPALNYRPQIYGLINVNNLVLSRFTAPKFHQSNRKVVQKLIMIQKGSMYT